MLQFLRWYNAKREVQYMYSSVKIANFFIEHSLKETRRGLFMIPLIKLPYIAHGFCLALTDRPLCYEPVEVWKYGPVFSNIYHTFKNQPSPKDKLEVLNTKEQDFQNYEKKIMRHTFKLYGNLSSLSLSSLTHQKGTPWYEADKNDLSVIPNEELKKYYKNLLDKSQNEKSA